MEKMQEQQAEENILRVNTETNTTNNTNNTNNTREQIIHNSQTNDISQTNDNYGIKQDPPYGILKNGRKTLYSKYRKSLKATDPLLNLKPHKTSQIKDSNIIAFVDETNFGKELTIPQITDIKINTPIIQSDNSNIIRKNKLEKLKETFIIDKKKKKKNEKFKVKNKKIKKRFILGKNSKTRKIAVLIKNKKTRRLINKDCNFLKKKKLKQIKSVLVNNALIKVGTQAPEKLLREMYINRYLAGDIQNTGGKNAEEILMHNWNS